MKKRLFVMVIAVLAIVSLFATCLVACDNSNDDTPTPTPDDNKVKVSWYDGTTLLKEEKVEKGSTVSSWDPQIEGKTFMNWYSEASMTELFDFSLAITEDTIIFAGFRTDAFTEDTTVWCLIGAGAGTLKESNWNENEEVEKGFKLTKLDEAGVNKFTMDVVLYEGDSFQIREMGTWSGQHGVGYVDGYTVLEEPDGDILGVVKDADGNVVFYATKGFGDSANGWNTNVKMSGKYTLTLQTFPGSNSYDKIYWTRTGDAPALTKTHEMYVVGSWSDTFAALEEYMMETDQIREDFSFVLDVTEDMYKDWTATDPTNPLGVKCAAIKVKNEIAGGWYGVSEQKADADSWTLTTSGQDNLFLLAGRYKITFNVTANTAKVDRVAQGYYLAGVLDGKDQWLCSADHALQKVSDTEYVAYYQFTAQDYKDWMLESAGAVKVAYGYGGLNVESEGNWFGDASGENVMIPSVGYYQIKLTLDAEGSGVVTVTKLEGYYLVGTIGAVKNSDTWEPRIGNEMTKSGENWTTTYTFEENDTNEWCKPAVAAIKVIYVAENGDWTWYGDAYAEKPGDNVLIKELGTYVITLDLSDGNVTAEK